MISPRRTLPGFIAGCLILGLGGARPAHSVLHEELRKVKGGDFEVVQPPPGYQPPPTE